MDIQQIADLCNNFLQCLHDGIAVVDNNGKIIFVNDSNHRITGMLPEELLGRSVNEAVPYSNVPDVLKTGIEKIGVQTEVNGKKVISNIAPLVIDHNMLGVVSVFREFDEVIQLTRRLEEANVTIDKLVRKLEKRQESNEDMVVGSSHAMVAAVNMAQKSSKVDSTVLLRGESGSGKEVIARMIHQNGARKDKPFVAVNCAAIPEMLLESELFGYVGGAFTGAKKTGHSGLVESAHGGTLFFDEIGDMPLLLQSKILRLLQEKKYMPVGDTRYKDANVRFIAATNRDLEKMIVQKTFREDLYYRLSVIKINIPPLRDRKEDLIKYINFILEKLSKKINKDISHISKNVLKEFYAYDFPGNIRELENLLEMAIVLDEDGVIDRDDILMFDENMFLKKSAPCDNESGFVLKFAEPPSFKTVEKMYLQKMMENVSNRKKLSEIMGISRSTLYQKITQMDCQD